MSSALLAAAYLSTTYRVDAPTGPAPLRVGWGSRALDRLLQRRGRRTWAFVTACNPRSRRLPAWRNLLRQRRLRTLVEQLRYPFLPGAGVGDDSAWPPEASLLIMGISPARACRLARLFGQSAIVVGRRTRAAELVWCGTERGGGRDALPPSPPSP